MKYLIILICIIGVSSWDIKIKGPSSVQIGSTLSLSCNATDMVSPPRIVVWYKGYSKLALSERVSATMLWSPKTITSKLTIKDVVRQDAGKYKCWVSNEIVSQVTVAVVDTAKAGGESTQIQGISPFTSLVFLSCFLKILG
ncbi:uncharacterized protein LOC123556498 [Mercenaria mercenaria]|uniref:uncharacterized protein LOC123556498 n=1 Tax=Mercenaria mercenaria TaxID=6596 RepID=UPI001E1DABF3|nr:uncharacterized protein LOC123556498 [Mercenaria mercenaria]